MTSDSVDMINHPPHYTQHPSGWECIQVTRHCPFSLGNAIKYLWRAEHKNGSEDLKKARWYLNDVIEHGGTFPPFPVSRMLRDVAKAESDEARYEMFMHLAAGYYEHVVKVIDEVLGD
ncbi:hypothetical protein SEA_SCOOBYDOOBYDOO_178 [Mycobacterium phage ScoobyDoobyDoo]|nr:hypothetical protein SEA_SCOOBYDOOBYDOO_178 [Mycobacterium phage ScoobyDoobyDoo]